MNKKKKTRYCLSAILVIALLAGTLTGCVGECVGIGFQPDGSCSYSMKYMIEKSMYNYASLSDDKDISLLEGGLLGSGDFQTGTENINGKEYYTYSRDFTFADYNALTDFLTKGASYREGLKKGSKKPKAYSDISDPPFSSLTMDESGFVGKINPKGDMALFMEEMDGTTVSSVKKLGYDSVAAYYKSLGMLLDITVTLPVAVVESNGAAVDKTVSWDMESIPVDGKLIAATAGNPISADTVPPTISGVKHNGTCGTGKITGKDDVSLKALILDGIRQPTDTVSIDTSGRHTITLIDANNNSTTVDFKVDAKKPKITGAKNGRLYKRSVTLRFSDDSGIRYVTVNGKKIKSKKKVTLKKTKIYTVRAVDKYGNSTSLYFGIKKNHK